MLSELSMKQDRWNEYFVQFVLLATIATTARLMGSVCLTMWELGPSTHSSISEAE